MIQLFIILALFTSCKTNANTKSKTEVLEYQAQVNQVQPDTVLIHIQSKIYNAFVQSLMSNDNTPLSKVSEELAAFNTVNKNNLILYWRSYLQYYSSIHYLEKKDRENAEKEIDKGIDWLTEMEKKNSEDYALLALLQSFGMQFKGMKAMFIVGAIKKNAKRAMAMDSTNLRAYYVYASNDFHTPAKYGGGKEAEQYLLKAISLPVQKVKNKYLPSWGKEEAYEMLIKLYIKKEEWDSAKRYFQEGIKAYPESHTINQLASKLVGK